MHIPKPTSPTIEPSSVGGASINGIAILFLIVTTAREFEAGFLLGVGSTLRTLIDERDRKVVEGETGWKLKAKPSILKCCEKRDLLFWVSTGGEMGQATISSN